MIVTLEDNMAKKSLIKQMEDTSKAWVNENPQERNVLCFLGDREEGITTCGIHGREDHLVETLVNEMLADDDVANVIHTAMQVYKNILAEEAQEKTKEIKTKFLS